MRNNFLIFATGALLAACTATAAADGKYTVTGTDVPDDFEGQSAFLVNYDTGEKIDSTFVEDGKALFAGTLSQPALTRLIIDGNRMGSFILEAGDITISKGVATGSPLNEEYNGIQQHLRELSAKYQALPNDSIGQIQREAVTKEYEAYTDSVFAANIDNPIGYSFYLDKAFEMDLDEMEKFLAEHPAFKNYVRAGKMLEAARKKVATSPGHKFVDFTITNDTTSQSLSDYVGKGKPVLVDFWASWCGPCIRETAVVKDLLNEYGPQGLEVLGVAVWDEPQNTKRAIEQHQLPWPQILNAQTVPTDLYGIAGIPCILLIAPDGTIVSRDKQDDELRADVKALMESLKQ
jgi:thiol-disulfide isomerase/thioredoxin